MIGPFMSLPDQAAAQVGAHAQGVDEEISQNGDLGQLKREMAGIADNLRARS